MTRLALVLTALALATAGCDTADPVSPDDDTPADDTPTPVPPLAETLEPGTVRAGVVTDPTELLAGPKASGQVGDLKIYNAHVAFVIEAARHTSGYRYWGGTPVDVALLDGAGGAIEDLFGEVIPTWNLTILHPDTVEVVDDGAESGVAHVRATGVTGPFDWATQNKFVFFELTPTALEVVYDYRLGPDDTALEFTATLTQTSAEPLLVDAPFVLSMHGDGVFPWVPGAGFEAAWGTPVPYVGVAGRDLAYAFVSETDDLASFVDYASITILQQDPFEVPGGGTVTRRYWLTVTDQGPTGLDEARRALLGEDAGVPLTGSVTLPPDVLVETAWVAAWADDVPVSLGPVRSDGTFELFVEPGAHTLRAHAYDHARGPAVDVDVGPAGAGPVELSVPAAAILEIDVVDAAGAETAGRVTVVRTGPNEEPEAAVLPWPKVNWNPTVTAFGYALPGEGAVAIRVPGDTDYELTATRGFTAELDTVTLSPAAGEVATATLTVEEVVDTTGWVAADFHVHAGGSWDSHEPPAARAREAVCEGLDVPVLTDHGQAGGLDEVAALAGVADALAAPAGQEVTSFLYGHFNVFPLDVDEALPNRGAVYPLDKGPLALFDAIATQGSGAERIVQINHPRNGTLGGYFDHVGFSSTTGDVALDDEWTLDGWHAIEVFNGSCGGGQNLQTLDDWVALTNLGHRKVLSSGSDSHSPGVPMGMPRNYVELPLADAQADVQALVEAVRGRRMVVSCGPFVRFSATDGAGLGDLADTAAFDVHVEAPSWMAVHELRLLENGAVIETIPLEGDDPVVRYSGTLTAAPTADAWYAVEVVGSGSLAPVSWSGEPYALTNPIEVDADGDGAWTPPGLPD